MCFLQPRHRIDSLRVDTLISPFRASVAPSSMLSSPSLSVFFVSGVFGYKRLTTVQRFLELHQMYLLQLTRT